MRTGAEGSSERSLQGGRRAPLRVNWILARDSLAGGVKSNRLLAEALAARGHVVHVAYSALDKPWPPVWKPLAWARRLRRPRARGHLAGARVPLIPVRRPLVTHEDVPPADFQIASWWQVREALQGWPTRAGRPVYLIRHHELHGGEAERVRATYGLPGLKIVIARWLQRVMREEYGDPEARLVPNGIDWSIFDSCERRPDLEAPTVGMLYGIQDWKGARVAFEALALAQRELPALRVLAFGRVPLRPEPVPPKQLEYHLRPSPAQVAALARRCECWLLPSRLEGFGMPGLEAAASHCPVVSTRCGGPEDYVEHGRSGYLVAVDDPREMADALLRVLRQAPEDWAAMSRASYGIARGFTWERSAERLEEALWAALETPAS